MVLALIVRTETCPTFTSASNPSMIIKNHGIIFQRSQRGPQEANVAGNADLGLYVVAFAGGSAPELQVSTKKRTGFSKYSRLYVSSMYQTCDIRISGANLQERNDPVIL